MNTSMSVKLYQGEFSADPFYTTDRPPLVLSEIATENNEVFLSTYDPYVVSSNNQYQEETDWEILNSFSKFLLKREDQYDHTPSLFVSHSGTYNREEETDDESNLSMNILRSIATRYRDEASRNKHQFYLIDKCIALSMLTSSSISKFLRSAEVFSLNLASGQYSSIFSDFLIPLSFSPSAEYVDVFGGRVVDYFRGVERISCIVSTKHVQILSFINDSFGDKTFEQVTSAKLDIVKYVEELVE